MTAETEQRTTPEVRDRTLWFSLGAGVVVWALHLMIVYPITSITCEWGWFPDAILGMPGLQFVQLAVTVIAALIVLVAGILALGNWRVLRANVPENEPEAARRPFMAFLGILLNGLFLLSILTAIVPILTLEACGLML